MKADPGRERAEPGLLFWHSDLLAQRFHAQVISREMQIRGCAM
jgi:hypothetical protein